jgi:GNAT superfamily N-acetyltransferase
MLVLVLEAPAMTPIEVRPFRRGDRDQLTQLVNAHAAAVVPGVSASVSSVLASLEGRPGEFVVDPWVSERVTLVAEQADRVAAAAHLLRYFPDERAGQAARNTGEINWLLFWPEAPEGNRYWPDATPAAEALMTACITQLEEWRVTQHADGELPVPGVYGVPDQWPHVSALYERAGFKHEGHTEIVYLARLVDLPRPADPPVDGLAVRRRVGMNGTRLSAVLGDDEVIGFIEVEVYDDGERLSRRGGLADVGNLRVAEPYRRHGVGSWLLSQAADWLNLAGVDRLLDYAWLEGTDPGGIDYADQRAFLAAVGFRELTRTRRGWARGA